MRARAEGKRKAAAATQGTVRQRLGTAYVLATLNDRLSSQDVVINEAIRNGPIVQEQIVRTEPQSYVGLAGGGLGFSGGMALGLKLAQPQRRIVQIIGDGGFHFVTGFGLCRRTAIRESRSSTVVLDNGGWQAVNIVGSARLSQGFGSRQ